LAPAIIELQSRLKRFDALLPRYQRVLSQVYDTLDVRGLDDVLPALRQAIASER
jgi:hypothetical protein